MNPRISNSETISLGSLIHTPIQSSRATRINYWVLLTFYLLQQAPFVKAEVVRPEDTREVLASLIEPVKAIKHPISGRGIAVLTEKGVGKHVLERDEGKYLMKFQFKEEQTRTGRFEFGDDQIGERKSEFAMGRKLYVRYNGSQVHVKSEPENYFLRRLSHDYGPSTFLTIMGRSLITHLERMIERVDSVAIDIGDETGLVTINWGDTAKYVLDPHKGFRLTEFEYNYKGREGESPRSRKERLKVSWKRYGSSWYPDKVQAESSTDNVDSHVGYSKTIDIKEFYPNPDINDEEFTLAALDVPIGTHVIDDVLGLSYRYGNPAITLEALEELLATAEFPRRIIDQTSSATVQASEGIESDGHVGSTSTSMHEASTALAPANESNSRIWALAFTIFGLIVSGCVIAPILRKKQMESLR